ncbi:MAG: DUF975 family protein [Halanaerobiaceae bacterium]
MLENYKLRQKARNQLRGQWGTAILLNVIYGALGFLPALFMPRGSGYIINLLLAGPLTLGIIACFVNLIRGKVFRFEMLFDGFSNFKTAFFTYVLMIIFIGLWSFLLVIPGIIAFYRYSMAFYILNDEPDLTAMEAINKSKEMMYGYKGKLFMLNLSFIGWSILSTLTLFIGYLWLAPYIQTSLANFYQNLKEIHEPENSSDIMND